MMEFTLRVSLFPCCLRVYIKTHSDTLTHSPTRLSSVGTILVLPFYSSQLNDLRVQDTSYYVYLLDNSRTRRRRFQPRLRRTHRYRETTTYKHRILNEGREARIRLSRRSSPHPRTRAPLNIRRRIPRRWVQSMAYRFRGQYLPSHPIRVASCQFSLLSDGFFFRRCATLSQRWFHFPCHLSPSAYQ